MPPLLSNLYAQWRLGGSPGVDLREGSNGSEPSEKLLQAVWQNQRLQADKLHTSDGRTVKVLHPGFWNHEAGPDFRDAVIQLDGAAALRGDVEIDLSGSGWRGHGHHSNPNYRGVILHVVWRRTTSCDDSLATVAVCDAMDASIDELRTWFGNGGAEASLEILKGRCCSPLRSVGVEKWSELLRQAAVVRFESKSGQLLARARVVGWEQALWEGLFGALGYKKNVWPMKALAIAISAPRTVMRNDALSWQAHLLGLSGLLPPELPAGKKPASEYVRQVWEIWWREQERLRDRIVAREAWNFSGLRPANHPQRRLALAAHWLARKDFVPDLERWFAAHISESDLVESLLAKLQVQSDDFWAWHWTLNSKRNQAPQPLLGTQRTTDLAINVILPWFQARASAVNDERLRGEAERRYFAWPKAEDNAVLKLARARLFGGVNVKEIRTASAQQGVLQIVRDFCQNSNALCDNCPFPDLVKAAERQG
ncbi:MAG: DUF2851 family protein [Pedosphaera sp.]|nr:DUF2851 family protein [Pedosphaera sp.]